MSYVPVPIVVQPEEDTPRVRELARELQRLVADYRQRNPSVSDREIDVALRVVANASSPTAARVGALIAGLVALVVAGVVAYLVAGGSLGVSWPWIATGLVALIGIVAMIVNRAR